MNKHNAIYGMGLGERLHTDKGLYEIVRVPGGWIYSVFSDNGTGGYYVSSCFVPFNSEFDL